MPLSTAAFTVLLTSAGDMVAGPDERRREEHRYDGHGDDDGEGDPPAPRALRRSRRGRWLVRDHGCCGGTVCNTIHGALHAVGLDRTARGGGPSLQPSEPRPAQLIPLLDSGPAGVGLNRGVRVHVFSAKRYERPAFETANVAHGHELEFLETRLEPRTARLVAGADAVCVFVNDVIDADVLSQLARARRARRGPALRRVQQRRPRRRGTGRHHRRARAGLFAGGGRRAHAGPDPEPRPADPPGVPAGPGRRTSPSTGCSATVSHGRTAGVIGTGRIGAHVARLLLAFGCTVLAHDPFPDQRTGGGRRAATSSCRSSIARADVIALTCPLTPETFHLVDDAAIAAMRPGVMLVNTGRGALIDTAAVIEGAEVRPYRIAGPRRLRGGGRAVLRGPLDAGDHRRRVRPPADLSERADHRAPGRSSPAARSPPSPRPRWPTSTTSPPGARAPTW